jgi:hypothetical protein
MKTSQDPYVLYTRARAYAHIHSAETKKKEDIPLCAEAESCSVVTAMGPRHMHHGGRARHDETSTTTSDPWQLDHSDGSLCSAFGPRALAVLGHACSSQVRPMMISERAPGRRVVKRPPLRTRGRRRCWLLCSARGAWGIMSSLKPIEIPTGAWVGVLCPRSRIHRRD